jgi:putative salt-induced outer membrane protein YdiY
VSIAVFALALPGQAAAQSPGSSDASGQPTLAQDVASAPKPGQSSATVSIGGQIQNGRTETTGLNVDGIVAHTTKSKQLLRLDVEGTYARYRAAPGTPSFSVANNQLATLTYLQPLRKRAWLFGMTGWRRDTKLQLDYRAWIEGGAGVAVIAHSKVNAFVGGSFSVGKEHREDTKEGSNVLDPGILQTLNIHLTDLLSFEEWLTGHVNATDTANNSFMLNASFLAKVSKHVGMKIYYKVQHDTLHPASVSATQSTFGGGLQVSFASTPAPAPAKP